MKLLIDIGNSRIKGAQETDAGLQALPILAYQESGLPEVLAAWDEIKDIESCWVASVGHTDLCEQVRQWAKSRFGIEAEFARSSAHAFGVTSAYEKPENLGVDRWLSMIAAYEQSQSPAVIVSAGTAVTIDAIDASGQHLGGLIAPGLNTQRKAMLQHTQVRAQTEGKNIEWLGKSTDACVTLGTQHTILGYIDRVTGELRKQGKDWRWIISGGDAGLLRPQLQGEWQYEPGLVLKGLSVMANSTA